jgi:peptidyl-dipeptidase Dcp
MTSPAANFAASLAAPDAPGNPLLAEWTTPDEAPPFDRIKPAHFRGAYARALADHEAEIAAITADPAPPSFDNTIAALELAGRSLARVGDVFHLLTGAHSNDALLEIEREISPQMARHWNKINTNAALFGRVDTLMHDIDRLGLDAEQKRVLERYHTGFRRAGAGLDDPAKKRLSEITERLATLGTTFSQNVLADEQAFTLAVDGEAELAGLPDFMCEAMKSEAQERKLNGHVVTLSRSSVEPFLQFSKRRDLREKIFRAFAMRGDNGGAPGCLDFPISPITGSTTPWPRRRPRCAICSTRCGRGRGKRRWPTATPCRRSWPRTAATSSSPPGTGAITPRSSASGCATSTR